MGELLSDYFNKAADALRDGTKTREQIAEELRSGWGTDDERTKFLLDAMDLGNKLEAEGTTDAKCKQ